VAAVARWWGTGVMGSETRSGAPGARGSTPATGPNGVANGDDRRLLAAYEAALAVAAEVTPEAVLQRIADLAREVVPARYARSGWPTSGGG
jgi:hypothetical protein